MATQKTKSFWIKLTAIAVAVALVAGTGLFLLLRRPTIVVASRGEVIELMDDHGITRWLEQTLRMNIRWVDYGDDPFTRIAQSLEYNPGDLPDAYLGLGLNSNEIDILMQQHAFLTFDHMIGEHAPNLTEIINRDISRLPEFQIDGRMVSLPSLNEHFSQSFPQRAWINREWLQTAGLDMPQTPQELLAALRAFQQFNNSEPTLGAAYQGSSANRTTLGFLVQAFAATEYDLSPGSNYLNVNNQGEVYAAVVQPDYREALRFLNQLYSEGLIDETVFDQGPDVFMGTGAGSERYGVIFANDLYSLTNDMDRVAAFEPLPPLLHNGQRSTLARPTEIQLGGFMIPQRIDANRQQLALSLGDALLSSEGTLTVLYGRQGWADADPDAGAMGAESATWRMTEDAALMDLIAGVPLWMDARLQMEQQRPYEGELRTSQNWQGFLNVATRNYYEPVGRANIQNRLPQLQVELETDALGTINDYLVRASQEFVTGARDIENDWEAFVGHLNTLGLQNVVNTFQAALDATMSSTAPDSITPPVNTTQPEPPTGEEEQNEEPQEQPNDPVDPANGGEETYPVQGEEETE